MVVESLSAELERLYELEELKSLSAGLLGLDPKVWGWRVATTRRGMYQMVAERLPA